MSRRGHTVAWCGLQGGQLQMAIELAGGTCIAPGGAPGRRQQLQVTGGEAVPGAGAAGEASISAELLTVCLLFLV